MMDHTKPPVALAPVADFDSLVREIALDHDRLLMKAVIGRERQPHASQLADRVLHRSIRVAGGE